MLNEITITKYASIRKPITFYFGRTNLIIGSNMTGKTAICDGIRCLHDYKMAFSKSGARFSGESVLLKGVNLLQNKATVLVEREIELKNRVIKVDKLKINGVDTFNFDSLTSILRIIHIDDGVLRGVSDDRKFAKFCMTSLTGWRKGLTKQHFLSLHALLKLYNAMPSRMFESIEWSSNNKLQIRQWGEEFIHKSFDTLSGSGRCLFLTDISILLAHMFSEYRPTLIILDGLLNNLDSENIKKIGKRINSILNMNLQFILTTWKGEAEGILEPDNTIKLGLEESKDGKFTFVSDTIKRTPKNILDIESRIRKYDSGNEDEFINTVVLPLLFKMGFSLVKRVPFHGPGELGLDIGPFSGTGFEWRKAFCGAQVKSIPLNAKAGNTRNINALIDEVKTALNNKFYDQSSALYSKLDYVFVFLSQYPTREALSSFYSAFDGDRRVIILDPIRIAELIWNYSVPIS